MAWKVERWLADVFPGEVHIYGAYKDLSSRELAIVTAAVLDAALAELLALRLKSINKEVESFLGLNGDGRAPVSSFGARIQLALLLGILTPRDAEILRTIKGIRNEFAHRVNAEFLSPFILHRTTHLLSLWTELSEHLAKSGSVRGSPEALENLKRMLPQEAEAGQGLLLAILSVYQAYFHRIHSHVKQIDRAI